MKYQHFVCSHKDHKFKKIKACFTAVFYLKKKYYYLSLRPDPGDRSANRFYILAHAFIEVSDRESVTLLLSASDNKCI